MDVQHGFHNKKSVVIQRLNIRPDRFGHRLGTLKASGLAQPKH